MTSVVANARCAWHPLNRLQPALATTLPAIATRSVPRCHRRLKVERLTVTGWAALDINVGAAGLAGLREGWKPARVETPGQAASPGGSMRSTTARPRAAGTHSTRAMPLTGSVQRQKRHMSEHQQLRVGHPLNAFDVEARRKLLEDQSRRGRLLNGQFCHDQIDAPLGGHR